MHRVKLMALRDLSGDYGNVNAGEEFTTDNLTAEKLEAKGLVEMWRPEVKIQLPPENKVISPFANKSR